MSDTWGYSEAAASGTVVGAFLGGLIAAGVTGAGASEALFAAVLFSGTLGLTLTPLYVSQPRATARLLRQTGRRVGLACLVLIGLGVIGFPGVLTVQATLGAGFVLAFVLSGWYSLCRRRYHSRRVLMIGDSSGLLDSTHHSLPTEVVGYLAPPDLATELTFPSQSGSDSTVVDEEPALATDGGALIETPIERPDQVDRLGRPSQLGAVLREHDVDVVALAFSRADREECFGRLRTCHEHGVETLVHESLASQVWSGERVGESLRRVKLEPWPWYRRLTKRAFDVAFATAGLLVLAPVVLLLAFLIKLDSSGPVLYAQTRTAKLGETFTLPKFRSMVTDAETGGAELSREDAGGVDPRVTRVGRLLRKTHLDEIPQLVSILRGEMSVVGPRPERPEIDREIEADGIPWSKRWFVKPGLTGPAQINDATGFEPGEKLAYDLEYIRRQSLLVDLKLVALQVWTVITDVTALVTDRLTADADEKSSRT
jgi:lipopolysaccharide/colanic/teichoic acid biosynthesis glycosyltransferase